MSPAPTDISHLSSQVTTFGRHLPELAIINPHTAGDLRIELDETSNIEMVSRILKVIPDFLA